VAGGQSAGVITFGKVLGGMDSPALEILYLQKLFAVMGVALLIQVFGGIVCRLSWAPLPFFYWHPGFIESTPAAIYTSLLICGALLARWR
jgi:hypothetical protein